MTHTVSIGLPAMLAIITATLTNTVMFRQRSAHQAVLRATGLKAFRCRFGHGAEHILPGDRVLLDSYHCSRYNTQTRRLDETMFRSVFQRARELLQQER